MNFCSERESLLSPANEGERCVDCGGSLTDRASAREGGDGSGGGATTVTATTDLERLPTTGSGAVRKRDATRWLESLDEPTPRELRRAVVPKPQGFSGSTHSSVWKSLRTDEGDVPVRRVLSVPNATIRGGRLERPVTGDPEFVETVAGLFGPLLGMENHRTRLEINLQETDDRDTGEPTDNCSSVWNR
ncbi:hypothetical protein ACFQE8_09620 [Salinirubellus sp. GCM10025818]|uniref:hypothetical protein n=1 Tax=Salinirubellus TaxID=2162630 RepID=UPI0030CB2452